MEKTIIKESEKIWGLYPGILTEEQIENLDEYTVWELITCYTNQCYTMTFNTNNSRYKFNSEQIKEISYTLDFLIYYTRNFGVEFEQIPNKENHIVRTDSYKEWYKSWQNHFTRMPKRIYEEFLEEKEQGKDITRYMKY